MKKSAPLIFFGNERLATGVSTTAPVLSGLIDQGYEVAAVITNFTEARSRKTRTLEVAEVAADHNIPLLYANQADPAIIARYEALAGILVAYGQIVPKSVIDVFPRGIINIHPSLLPEYRGSTPVEQAILDGKRKTGVSLMSLQPKMDAGPVYSQVELELNGKETKQQLADKLLLLGRDLLMKRLPSILDRAAKPMSQNERAATYTKLIQKEDGRLNWKKPAIQLEREVRAYAGWPKSQTEIFGQSVIITKARVAESSQDGHLVLPTGQGWLEVQALIAPSGRNMSGADFVRGYKKN